MHARASDQPGGTKNVQQRRDHRQVTTVMASEYSPGREERLYFWEQEQEQEQDHEIELLVTATAFREFSTVVVVGGRAGE